MFLKLIPIKKILLESLKGRFGFGEQEMCLKYTPLLSTNLVLIDFKSVVRYIYIPLPIKYANHDCGAFGDNPNWNFSFADLDSLEPDGGLIIILDKNRAVGERKPLGQFF